jgi:hypothetical protein
MQDVQKERIVDIVGSPIWVSTTEGQKVYDAISALLRSGAVIELSFAEKEMMITAFLNAAIGQLYNGQIAEDVIRKNLKFVDLDADDLSMVERTITNAKRYFANPPAFDAAWSQEVGHDDDEE